MKASLSRVATDLLSAERSALSAPSAADDARAILAIEAAIHGAARRRRTRRRAFTGALALAATFAVLAGGRLVLSGSSVRAPRVATPAAAASPSARGTALAAGAVVVRGGRESALSDDVALEARDRIVTAHAGRASITLSTGTRLVVDPSSDVTLAEQGPTTSFAIAAGSVHADVAKLHPGERFIIRAPDGEVEVWGTSFDVSVVTPSPGCGGGTSMRVVVSEGVVVVRSAGAVEDRVTKGQSWPRACAPVEASATPSANVLPTVVAPSTPTSHGRGVQSAATPTATADAPAAVLVRPLPPPPLAAPAAPEPASELAAQNALFAEAAAARRRGDSASAVAAYDRLAVRYPSSPLTENAYVERMRVIAASDARRGADAARAYLARYPRGFARTEASDLVASQR